MTVIDLSGRVAIVTGASRGIGRAAAETLLKAGAIVVLNARASDEATAAFAELERAYPDRVTAVYGSVAESATATALIQAAMKHKRLDILVNNAGILRDKLIGMISDAEINELFDVNIIGLINHPARRAPDVAAQERLHHQHLVDRRQTGKQRPDGLFRDQGRRHRRDVFRR
jgi:NAD(P)-dependent dehydrogenase (short-subunit alcohol dehydrogenase family)